MESLWPYLKQRRWALVSAALLGVAARCLEAGPPERSLAGVAEMLGRASAGAVRPEDVAWEPAGSFLGEALLGRGVLFLSAPAPGKPRDVFRGRVRLTWNGDPVSVARVKNLTETPLGDESSLSVRGAYAAFATRAYGRVQAVSVLELEGVRAEDRASGVLGQLTLAVNAYQDTHSFSGIGRTDIVLDLPAQRARLTLQPPELRVDLGEREQSLVYDVWERSLRGADRKPAQAARAVPQVHRAKPLVLWAVDTVRAEVGPEPIAWLEDQVFGAKDLIKRAAYQVLASSSEKSLKQTSGAVPSAVLRTTRFDDAEKAWPPPPIPSLWEETKTGEGEWQPVVHSFLRTLPASSAPGVTPPPYFYRTFIRPDPKRPYSTVKLIAMDMRQLELGMQAGFEDPKPLTGPPGDGRLPRDPRVSERVVATFNGAFKSTHGNYGMMVDGRVLLPPVRGAATVMVTDDGDTGLGSWPDSDEVPADMLSFRQNLDPLVEDGVANPTGRFIWGWQLAGKSVMTQRTAICVTPAGHLYYAFAPEIDGRTLGKALQQAGCSYGIHLDMNPAHCGFVFTDVVDAKAKEFQLRLADPEMKIYPDKFVRWSAKDFFYVLVRDPKPHTPLALEWTADGGTQPPPAWMDGIFRARTTVGSTEVALLSFEPGRVEWQLSPGTAELGGPETGDAAVESPSTLSEAEARRVLASLALGNTTPAAAMGLALTGTERVPMLKTRATVIIGGETPIRIEAPGSAPRLTPAEHAVQLPLLADAGQPSERAKERSEVRQRGALCVTGSGRVLLAQARADSAQPLASTLLSAGCDRVVELERGAEHAAFVHRAGTRTPPLARYDTTVLYALGRPMLPRATRWKAKNARPSTKPTGYDLQPAKLVTSQTPSPSR